MKKMKRGFTLAEVILCVGIIGIVTALGLKVTQDATQRAYNKYIETGYENLYYVLKENKGLIKDIKRRDEQKTYIEQTLRNYFDPQGHNGSDNTNIHANNGIVFTVEDGAEESAGSRQMKVHPISMTFPYTRGRGNGTRHTCFLYFPTKGGYGSLVPATSKNQDNMPDEIKKACKFDDGSYVDVQENAALLPFALDNSKMSYRTAYCQRNGSFQFITNMNEAAAMVPFSWKGIFAQVAKYTPSTEEACTCSSSYYSNYHGTTCATYQYNPESSVCKPHIDYAQCIEDVDGTLLCGSGPSKDLDDGSDDDGGGGLEFGGLEADPKHNPCDLPAYAADHPCECTPNSCACETYATAHPCECTPNSCACSTYAAVHKCECDSSYRTANPCECDSSYDRCKCPNPPESCSRKPCDNCDCQEYADENPCECGLQQDGCGESPHPWDDDDDDDDDPVIPGGGGPGGGINPCDKNPPPSGCENQTKYCDDPAHKNENRCYCYNKENESNENYRGRCYCHYYPNKCKDAGPSFIYWEPVKCDLYGRYSNVGKDSKYKGQRMHLY